MISRASGLILILFSAIAAFIDVTAGPTYNADSDTTPFVDNCDFSDMTKCPEYDARGWESKKWTPEDRIPKPTKGEYYLSFNITNATSLEDMTIKLTDSSIGKVTASIFFIVKEELPVYASIPFARLTQEMSLLWILGTQEVTNQTDWISKNVDLNGESNELRFHILPQAIGVVDIIAIQRINIEEVTPTTPSNLPTTTIAPIIDNCDFSDIQKCSEYNAEGWESIKWNDNDFVPKPSNGDYYIALNVTSESIKKDMIIKLKDSSVGSVTTSIFFTPLKQDKHDDTALARISQDLDLLWVLTINNVKPTWVQKNSQLNGRSNELRIHILPDAVGLVDWIAISMIDIQEIPSSPPSTTSIPQTPTTGAPTGSSTEQPPPAPTTNDPQVTTGSGRSNTYSVYGMILAAVLCILMK